MQTITPFLWFNDEAEEAANFYVSIFQGVFKKSRISTISRYSNETASASGQPEGSVMVVEFELNGMKFSALNGGKPEEFNTEFTGAISFVVSCKDQKQIDTLWDKLTADGGEPSQCGWLKDKFGVSWQIVPDTLLKYIVGRKKEGAERAMKAMMEMTKLDISVLKSAYEGK